MSLNSHLRRHLYIICSIFTLLMIGCAGKDHATLEKADAIMEEAPDSALMMLQEINRNHLNKSDLPYYALLKTQALVKTNEPVSSDSLISLAYKKYSDDWWGDKGIRSNFYMAEVFYNQEKPREAMTFYLHAYEESKRLNNPYWRAKSAERIADLFFNAYNYTEAEKYRKEAIDYYGLAGKITNQRYAISDLGSIYLNDGKSSKVVEMIDSILRLINKDEDPDLYLINYINETRIQALFNLGRTDELTDHEIDIIKNRARDREKLETAILFSISDYSQEHENKKDSILATAEKYLNTDEDTLQFLYAKYLITDTLNDKYQKLALADSIIYSQERITRRILKESVTSSQSEFYALQSKHQKKQIRLYLIIIVLSILVFLIIMLSIWRFYQLKSKLHLKELETNLASIITLKESTIRLETEKDQLNLQIQNNISSISNLHHEISEKNIVLGQLKEEIREHKLIANDFKQKYNDLKKTNLSIEIEQLFKEQWSILNMLCDEYFEKGDSEFGRNLIIKNIEKEIRQFRTKKNLMKIECEVNKYLDNIMAKLRNECRFLNEKDITFIMLIYAGFSVRAICLFSDIKYGTFYVKKGRIIKKISESMVEHRDEFIEKLD